MLLLRGQHLLEEVTGAVVTGGDTRLDAPVQPDPGLGLDGQVVLELLAHRLADAERGEPLQVGHPVEEQDPLDQRLGVLHLVDRLVADVRRQLRESPVVAHLGVDEVLVDRRELGGQARR